jgi:hypothetical protein
MSDSFAGYVTHSRKGATCVPAARPYAEPLRLNEGGWVPLAGEAGPSLHGFIDAGLEAWLRCDDRAWRAVDACGW